MINEFVQKKKTKRNMLIILGVILLFIVLGFVATIRFFTDMMWFESVNYSGVFWTVFNSKITVWFVAFSVVLIIGLINFFAGIFPLLKKTDIKPEIKKVLLWGALAFTAIVPIIFAFVFQSDYWQEYLKAINSQPIGTADPIFNNDIGYYLFQRDLLMGAVSSMIFYLIITLLLTGMVYFLAGLIPRARKAIIHLGALVSIIFFLAAYLHKFILEGIVFSGRGKVFGAGYTDVSVVIPYYRALMVILVISGLLTLFFSIRKKFSLLIFSGVGLYILTTIIGNIATGVVQNHIVSPNEIQKESKYIRYNIDYTRQGFGLDNVTEYEFPDNDTLSYEMIERNRGTIDNIRINDYRAVLQTYNQLQGLRRYYTFNSIDIDRYMINGELRQVFISPRELDKTQVSDTYVNMMYKYTHGLGVGLNAVNEVTTEGQPKFLIKNIPPVSDIDINIEQPRIYYGESTNDSVIVNASIKEFDYPAGESNMETLYEGIGGVSLKGLGRLMFAIREGNFRILFSEYITNESKIMMYRNIHDRVRRIAPFLNFDDDPYMVIADGELKWIIDAYTMSDRYPYSEPLIYKGRQINYIRNPIKVVVDAYDGTVDFYVVDSDEPFVMVYNKIYDQMFKSIDKMPASLRAHLRYPEDLFNIQTYRYQKYHMSDTTVFYNEEDLWQIATEKYFDEMVEMEAYYSLIKLPGEEREEFILMRPFTPVNRNNAISWMAAGNDGDNYGELLLYRFPKDRIVYGPMQVENRIDQDSAISRELTLLDQRGSRVIRGNLLMLPIEDTILYIEPLYLQSDSQGALPELKGVIASYRDSVVLEDTLSQALERLIGTDIIDEPRGNEEEVISGDLIGEAIDYLNRIKEASGKGEWIEFGRNLQRLEEIIRAMEIEEE